GGNVTGVPGDNGWFVSAVTVTAAASDATSGVVSLQYTLNGGAWTGYSGSLTLGNGVHSLQLRAMDAAGHIATAGETARVDTLSPALGLTGGGSFCPGCGGSLAVNYSVSDGGSGVAWWQLTAGSLTLASGSGPASASLGWDGGPSTGSGSGSGSLRLEARDLAGNTAQETLGFTIIVPTAIPPTAVVVAPPVSQGQVAVVPSGGQSPAATAPPLVQQATGAALAPGPTQPEPARPAVTVQFGDRLPLETLISSGVGGGGSPSGLDSDNLFWGSAAAGLIGAGMAYALEQQMKRKAEEAARAVSLRRMATSRMASGSFDAIQNQLDSVMEQRKRLESEGMLEKQDPGWQAEKWKLHQEEQRLKAILERYERSPTIAEVQFRLEDIWRSRTSLENEPEMDRQDPSWEKEYEEAILKEHDLEADLLYLQAIQEQFDGRINSVPPSGITPGYWAMIPEDERQEWADHFATRDIWIWMESLRVRSSPGDGDVIGYLSYGSTVHYTGRLQILGDGSKWIEVEYTDRFGYHRGWIYANATAEIRDDIPTEELFPYVLTGNVLVGTTRPELQYTYLHIDESNKTSPIRLADEAERVKVRHHNLCGQFSIAEVVCAELIDLLNRWAIKYPGALDILKDDIGTTVGQLKQILDVYNRSYFDYSSISPALLQTKLDAGQVFIALVNIDSEGSLGGTTSHWVVVKDMQYSGPSLKLRIYNPFHNRDEICEWQSFNCAFKNSGLWVVK
ncbi:MAG: hypothetical protein ABIJ39_06575, partial [Chloroflexota bacterium]